MITALSVFIAGMISNVHWEMFASDLFLASLSAALIAAGGNTFNDYCDRDLDRHQKSHRPIPSGQIAPQAALYWAAFCFIAGLLVSVSINSMAIIISSWAVFLLLFYSWRWKKLPFIGNFIVSFVAGLAFVYGGAAVESISVALWAALLAFLFHFGREIVKDMEDHWGDDASGASTLVVKYGINTGRWSVLISFLLLSIFLPFPYFFGNFQKVYLYLTLFGVLPVLILSGIWIWRWYHPEQLHRLNVLLKVDMLVGLAALFLGRPSINTPF